MKKERTYVIRLFIFILHRMLISPAAGSKLDKNYFVEWNWKWIYIINQFIWQKYLFAHDFSIPSEVDAVYSVEYIIFHILNHHEVSSVSVCFIQFRLSDEIL